MPAYEVLRAQYQPDKIKCLLVAESPPPRTESSGGSRHFYRATPPRQDDRLFVNTIQAIYPETEMLPEAELEAQKEAWLRRFQADGYFMTEALEVSQRNEVTKKARRELIKQSLPRLIERLNGLVDPNTPIILIKSNVYDVAAEPLRQAGFNVVNQELVDYPGHFNQARYRQKLRELVKHETVD